MSYTGIASGGELPSSTRGLQDAERVGLGEAYTVMDSSTLPATHALNDLIDLACIFLYSIDRQ